MLGLVELVVYGAVCYASVIGLIWVVVSTGVIVGRPQSYQPAYCLAFLIPAILAAGMLSTAGPEVTIMETVSTTTTEGYEYAAPNRTITNYGNITGGGGLPAAGGGAPIPNSVLTYDRTVTTERVVQTLPILNDAWVLFHYMLFVGLLIFMLLLVLSMFTNVDARARAATEGGGGGRFRQ